MCKTPVHRRSLSVKKGFLLGLIFFSAICFAKSPAVDCPTLLEAMAVPDEVRSTLQYFQSLGLTELLSEVTAGQVEVSLRRQWLPWQPAVSARINIRAQKFLVIRKTNVSTPLKLEKFRWQVAMALFELHMQPALWSKQALLPENVSAPASFKDFMDHGYKVPAEWRDQQLARTKPLLHELYILFDSMAELQAKDMMPAKDPGLNWSAKAILMMDASQAIAPNLADFEKWKNSQGEPIEALGIRHSRSIIFNYYMNHVKRMLMLSSVISTLTLIPHLSEIPSYIESHHSWVLFQDHLDQAKNATGKTEQANILYEKRKEIEQLNHEITSQEVMPNRDQTLISHLKAELQEDEDRLPGELLGN
jgi:hypothetical protein